MLKKLSGFFTEKMLAVVFLAFYIISCLPVIYIGLFNYATGDDLLYGSVVKRAIADHKSLIETLRLVWEDFVNEYYTFQGTWSSQLLWRFEPSIWGEKLYIITIFIAIGSLSFGTMYFLYTILVKNMGYSKAVFVAASSLLLFFSVQYMPFPRGGLYWYTGMTHYTMPYGLALIAIASSINFLKTGKKRYMVIIALILFYLGGSGYPSVTVGGIGVAYFMLIGFFISESEVKSRAKYFIIPLLIEAVGFIISAIAPGNHVRGGEDYGFSMTRVGLVFYRSIVKGIIGLFKYFIEVRPLFLLLIIVFTIALFNKTDIKISLKTVLLTAVLGLFLVCMTRSPEVFAGATVEAGFSGGVYDTYYYVSLLYVTIMSFMLGSYIAQNKDIKLDKAKVYMGIISFALLFCLVAGKYLIGNSLFYNCYTFISSGHLHDFEEQMQERFALLKDSEGKDVVVPSMNDEQGPIMHMPITEDPDNYTNRVTRLFYGCKSVVAMDRAKWTEEQQQTIFR